MNLAKEFELEPGEEVLIEARKHWLLFAIELLPYAIIAIIPFSLPKLLYFAPPLAPYAATFDYTTALGRAFIGAWLLITWTSAWGAFTRYYLNIWIVTDMRIVEVTQRHYFNRQVSSVLLTRIQDVTTSVVGFLPSILHIGNISVQSAGTVDEFHMYGIAHPETMRDLILREAKEHAQPADI